MTGIVPTLETDFWWMSRAIGLARYAIQIGDRPFGCVIVSPAGFAVAESWGTGDEIDPTAHSEMRAIRQACYALHANGHTSYLQGYCVYSTHQPCLMCSGGINHAKITRVVFGSYRSDLGHLFSPKAHIQEALAITKHPPEVIGGVRREECVALFNGVEKWDNDER